MKHIVLPTLVVVATVLGTGMIVPQVRRLHRTGSTDGVSIVWIGVGVAMNSWWVVYAVCSGLWGLLPVSIGAAALYLTMAAQFVRLKGLSALRGFAFGATLLGVVPVPALLLGGIGAAGVAVGLCYAVQFIPATIESFRSEDIGGLSFFTWLMALGEAAIWVVYGLAVADLALIIGGVGGFSASAVIVGQLIRIRKPRNVFLA